MGPIYDGASRLPPVAQPIEGRISQDNSQEPHVIFRTTTLAGVYLIDVEPHRDDRGLFARAWCRREFAQRRLSTRIEQASLAYTGRAGTVRGLHYQASPHAEIKLVRCVRGAAYVVVADLRPQSSTRAQWTAVELSAENRRALYVPEGCAQGYQTLLDGTELLYQMSEFYVPAAARGVRFDDPAFGFQWPLPVRNVSPRDLAWRNYEPSQCCDFDKAASSEPVAGPGER